jgi:hypothetical protein
MTMPHYGLIDIVKKIGPFTFPHVIFQACSDLEIVVILIMLPFFGMYQQAWCERLCTIRGGNSGVHGSSKALPGQLLRLGAAEEFVRERGKPVSGRGTLVIPNLVRDNSDQGGRGRAEEEELLVAEG